MDLNRKNAIKIWDSQFGKDVSATDFAGRSIQKGAFGQLTSTYGWCLTHILPRSVGGKTEEDNLICAHVKTAAEKEENFPSFSANEVRYKITKESGVWAIAESSDADALAELAEKEARAKELWYQTFGDADEATDFAGRTIYRDSYGSGRQGAWKVAPYVDSKPTENKNAYIAHVFTIAEALGKTAFKSNGSFFTLIKENGVYSFVDSEAKARSVTETEEEEAEFEFISVDVENETEEEITEETDAVYQAEEDIAEETDAVYQAEEEITEETDAVYQAEEEITEETDVVYEAEEDITEETDAVYETEEEITEETDVVYEAEEDITEETDAVLETEDSSAEESEEAAKEIIEESENQAQTETRDLSCPAYVSEYLDSTVLKHKNNIPSELWLDFIVIHTFMPSGTPAEYASALTDALSSIITEAAGRFITHEISELVAEDGRRNAVITFRFLTPGTADMEQVFNTCMLLNTYAPLLSKKFSLESFKVYNYAAAFKTVQTSYPMTDLAELYSDFKTFIGTVFNLDSFYEGEPPTTLYVSESVLFNLPAVSQMHNADDTVFHTDARLIEHNFVFGDIKRKIDELNS